MSKLEIAMKVIEEHYQDAPYGIFDTRNIVGDFMSTIYEGNGLKIDICYGYKYFEVFGLTKEEFQQLESYYTALVHHYRRES